MIAEALIGKEMCDTTKVKPCGTTEDTDIVDDTEFCTTVHQTNEAVDGIESKCSAVSSNTVQQPCLESHVNDVIQVTDSKSSTETQLKEAGDNAGSFEHISRQIYKPPTTTGVEVHNKITSVNTFWEQLVSIIHMILY